MRQQKIYCKECYCHYHLYVRSERLLGSDMLQGFVNFGVMFVIFGFMIFGVYYLDTYLKGIEIRET